MNADSAQPWNKDIGNQIFSLIERRDWLNVLCTCKIWHIALKMTLRQSINLKNVFMKMIRNGDNNGVLCLLTSWNIDLLPHLEELIHLLYLYKNSTFEILQSWFETKLTVDFHSECVNQNVKLLKSGWNKSSLSVLFVSMSADRTTFWKDLLSHSEYSQFLEIRGNDDYLGMFVMKNIQKQTTVLKENAKIYEQTFDGVVNKVEGDSIQSFNSDT